MTKLKAAAGAATLAVVGILGGEARAVPSIAEIIYTVDNPAVSFTSITLPGTFIGGTCPAGPDCDFAATDADGFTIVYIDGTGAQVTLGNVGHGATVSLLGGATQIAVGDIDAPFIDAGSVLFPAAFAAGFTFTGAAPGQQFRVVITAGGGPDEQIIPAPATLALLGFGLAGLGLAGRRLFR